MEESIVKRKALDSIIIYIIRDSRSSTRIRIRLYYIISIYRCIGSYLWTDNISSLHRGGRGIFAVSDRRSNDPKDWAAQWHPQRPASDADAAAAAAAIWNLPPHFGSLPVKNSIYFTRRGGEEVIV